MSRYDGGLNAVGLPVRAIITDAVRLSSAGVLPTHNHPSGDPTPSAPIAVPPALAGAGEAMDLAAVDRLVFAWDECRSFRRMALL